MDRVRNRLKEQRFRYPDEEICGFGRKLACANGDDAFWVAVQMEQSRTNRILLKKFSGKQSEFAVFGASGYCHQPTLVPLSGNRMALVWNESDADGWKIQLAIVGANSPLKTTEPATIWQSPKLCLPPAAVAVDGCLVVAWAALDDRNVIRIFLSREGKAAKIISVPGIDAMRPVLSAVGGRTIIAWDQYCDRRYEIAVARLDGNGAVDKAEILGKTGERWLNPVLTPANESAEVFMTWLGLKELSDDLGIADHFPFGMVARINPESGIVLLEENTDNENPAIVADLREGVLAEHTYKGYLGLRRRPQITISDVGEVYCCWESRIESGKTAVSGYLMVRKYSPKNGWSQPQIVCDKGYGYAVPPVFSGTTLPVAYFKFKASGHEIVQSTMIALAEGKPHRIDGSRWRRWRNSEIKPIEKPERAVKLDGNEYRLFWADTHCHSNFSADAEGEPDELVHFARDVAGLDVLCIIDNDYYPNKTLSEAEWRIHNAYAEHFTKPGEFVLFPGYEFTFHREDLSPDFNHRCVIYPQAGGKLLRRIDPGSSNDRELLLSLRQASAMVYPHHCSYEIIDNEQEWNVEVTSSWRICIEESDFTIRQLRAGKRLGFIGSSDAHRCNPGLGGALTGIFARELTPEALFDAYRNRRLIATQGFAAFIDFRVADAFIGDELACSSPPVVTAKIIAPEPVEYVEIIRDGASIFKVRPDRKDAEFEFKDNSVGQGQHFYFLKIKLHGDPGFNFSPKQNSSLPFTLDSKYPHNLAQARGVFAWTSPIWINMERK